MRFSTIRSMVEKKEKKKKVQRQQHHFYVTVYITEIGLKNKLVVAQSETSSLVPIAS